jgi:hypothetical protein
MVGVLGNAADEPHARHAGEVGQRFFLASRIVIENNAREPS